RPSETPGVVTEKPVETAVAETDTPVKTEVPKDTEKPEISSKPKETEAASGVAVEETEKPVNPEQPGSTEVTPAPEPAQVPNQGAATGANTSNTGNANPGNTNMGNVASQAGVIGIGDEFEQGYFKYEIIDIVEEGNIVFADTGTIYENKKIYFVKVTGLTGEGLKAKKLEVPETGEVTFTNGKVISNDNITFIDNTVGNASVGANGNAGEGTTCATITFRVTALDKKAFKKAGAKKVILNKYITCIPKKCFANCKKLKRLKIKGKLKEVQKKAFKGCKKTIKIKGKNKKNNLKLIKKVYKRIK
ncbi:MAG: leucine-rich repeat protein, partial [Lachnospiraceae bacterium]|nr:leucine-rich repeat protein [Lachnospiraceae bacterium]